MVEEFVDGGLEIVEIDLALGEPFLQSDEGWIGENFGEAGNVQLDPGRRHDAEQDDIIMETGSETLSRFDGEEIYEGYEAMASALGKILSSASLAKVICKIFM